MIKRSTLIVSVLVASGAVAALMAPGCSSSSSGGDQPPAYVSVKPPPRPTTSGTGTTKWFAMNALKLGLTTKAGVAKPDAWKDYGYDLDGLNTTADDSITSKNSCKRIAGSPQKVLADGNGGIDNNFGQHVMSVIKSLKSDAEEAVTKSVTDGKFSLILKIENAGGDTNKAPGALYVANEFAGADGKPATPTFGPTEVWPINSASLADGKTIGQPKLTFPDGYIANGYWVSGDFGKGRIDLAISLSGADISLPIDSGIVTVKLDGTDGTIAGAMNTGELQKALTPVARRFGICPGNATFDQVVSTLTQSADLVSSGVHLQDTTKTCDAISIAIGYTMKPAGDHATAKIYTAPVDPPKDDCTTGEGGETGPTDTGAGG